MTLHKFTNAYYSPVNNSMSGTSININGSPLPYSVISTNSEFVYVDLERVMALNKSDYGTAIHIDGLGAVIVSEHISEVIAILEGRDSMPSKILFGKKDKNEDT